VLRQWFYRLRNPAGLTGYYGYVWYLHAILTGAFVAYLPFSRLFHIIMAPIVLPMSAVSNHRNRKNTFIHLESPERLGK
jgi:nitrate reductase gamma subunit